MTKNLWDCMSKERMGSFKGQQVLITGATRGIGKETAELFLEQGAKVYITGTSDNPSQKLLEELKLLGEVEYLKANFSSELGIVSFIEKLKTISRIDVCVNNAGINLLHEIENISDEDYDKVLSVNLHAPVKICRYLANVMGKQGYGRIVNVASIWSVITKPMRGIYTISKNAIIGLTETMAIEMAPKGVIVNAISPGFTLTELTKNTNTESEISEIEKNIPIKRLATPKEMGQVILFLSSKENSYMTGQNIVVDGGFTNV